jgi:V/A-type H+-transporting ATPase subunit I
MVNVLSQIKNIFISPHKLVKIQIPKEYTHKFLTKIDVLDIFTQTVVDPQNPKEQALIQEFVDQFEDKRSRLVDISYKLNIPISIDFDSKLEEDEYPADMTLLSKEIDQFLSENEETISSLYQKLQLLKKEERVLSSISLLQQKTKEEDFSINLLSSNFQTHTFIGEIPSSYEEVIRFYLTELTAGKLFFWVTETDVKEKKTLMCITIIDYKDQIEEILNENHFDSTELDITFLKSLDAFKETSNIEDLYSSVSRDISAIEKELENFSTNYNEKIIQFIKSSHIALELLSFEEKGRTTDKDFTIWGWVKSKNIDKFKKDLDSFEFKSKVQILEDVPFSYKKSREVIEKDVFQPSDYLIEREEEKHIAHLSHRGVGVQGGFMFTKKASFIKLETSEKNSRKFISFIHSQNTIHPIKIGSQKKEKANQLLALRQELTQYVARIKKIQDNFDSAKEEEKVKSKYQLVDEYSHSKAFIENFLRDHEKQVTEIFSKYNKLKKELEQIELILPFEEELRKKELSLTLIEGGFQTKTYVGSIPKNHFKAVNFFLKEVTDDNILFWSSDSTDPKRNEKNILLLSLEDYDTAISRVLNEYSFQPLEFDQTLLQEKQALNEIRKEFLTEIEQKENEIEQISDAISEKLSAASELIEIELERISTEEICQFVENKMTLWGWIPADGFKKLYEAKNKLDFELEITLTEDVPLVNPSITKRGKLFGAVRGLVGGIGEPNPHEVDPYSIVRFTFPLLFGIMFADVGHGIMLFLIALFLTIRKRRKKIKPDESISGYLYSGSELLLFCGLSATIFGFLFGSLLGDEEFIPELMHSIGVDWIPLINPLHETKLFLVVALILGFLMLQLGIWLKVYQNIRYGHGVSSWMAPLSLSIVYVGIFTMLYNIIAQDVEWHAFHFTLPALPEWMVYLIAAAPILFIFEYLHAKSNGIMDAIDHIIALISNTLSFSRVMALLLVHAILSGIPFTLTGVHAPLSTAWYWWVVGILVGLIIIVPIEGLLSFLNTLRLHWVEWFSKFYVGDGNAYKPLTEESEFIDFVQSKGS